MCNVPVCAMCILDGYSYASRTGVIEDDHNSEAHNTEAVLCYAEGATKYSTCVFCSNFLKLLASYKYGVCIIIHVNV